MIKETWKPVKGYEKIYEVSNLGNFRNKNLNKKKYGRLIKGYKFVNVGHPRHERALHRLVMMTFKPIRNAQNYYVHHVNAKKTDNRLSNLKWVKPKEHSAIHSSKKAKVKAR